MTVRRGAVEALTISKTRQQQADRNRCRIPKSPRGVLKAEFSLGEADSSTSRNDGQHNADKTYHQLNSSRTTRLMAMPAAIQSAST